MEALSYRFKFLLDNRDVVVISSTVSEKEIENMIKDVSESLEKYPNNVCVLDTFNGEGDKLVIPYKNISSLIIEKENVDRNSYKESSFKLVISLKNGRKTFFSPMEEDETKLIEFISKAFEENKSLVLKDVNDDCIVIDVNKIATISIIKRGND